MLLELLTFVIEKGHYNPAAIDDTFSKGVYKDFESDGIIYLEDDSLHQIKVEVKDAYGNTSILQFAIKRAQIKQTDYNNTSAVHKFVPGYVNVFEREDIQRTT